MSFFYVPSVMVLILFMNSSHPVALMGLILVQTLNLCILTWLSSAYSWFSYILFLIFLGGLMVLFIYIVSLASNEKFNMNSNLSLLMIFILFFLIFLFYLFKENFILTQALMLTETLSKIYSSTMIMITGSTMIYLLLTLVVVVKMTSKYKGPMRSMIFNKS